MAIRYYVSVFPTEALIASQLEAHEFGAYMATGSNKGSSERLMFLELEGEFGDHFDWEYAHEKCVLHEDGTPKHSVYLSVYRVLEHIPLDQLRTMYLTTKDGRSLALEPQAYREPAMERDYVLYQELCPIYPLVVSGLPPKEFARYLTSGQHKIHVPSILFADLKVIDFERPEQTGSIGAMYDRNVRHLQDCIWQVRRNPVKLNKTIERSHGERFSYQIIDNGLYIAKGQGVVMYPMKSRDELRRYHYDWARSALIF